MRDEIRFGGQQRAGASTRPELPPQAPSGVIYARTDGLGSERVRSNGEHDTNWPFGEFPNFQNGVSPMHFTGKPCDSETGLDYFGARYYAPTLGRFLTPDDGSAKGAADPQSWNLYSYVENNPATSIDPDGHDCIKTSGASAGGVTVSIARGACTAESGGTFVAGTVDTNSFRYNGDTGELTYSYTPDTGGAGVGVLALPQAPNNDIAAFAQAFNATQPMAQIGAFVSASALGISAGEAAAAADAAATAAASVSGGRAAADLSGLSPKILRQMVTRGWTPQEIAETVASGTAHDVINKATGGLATEYVDEATGRFVVVDEQTGKVIQVSGRGHLPNYLAH